MAENSKATDIVAGTNVGAQMLMLGTCFKCLLHVYRESCSCSSSMCSLICIDAWLQTF